MRSGLVFTAAVLASAQSAWAFTSSPTAFVAKNAPQSATASTSHASPLLLKGSTIDVSAVEDSLFSAGVDANKALEDYVKDRGGSRVIKKVLIANNGMAATKSILSMRQWAYTEFGDENVIKFVAMATPEDIAANAEFIRLADTFVEVPGGKNLNNYANVTVINQVASDMGVDAVWPGWGHASENPNLPRTLTEMGIKFIGPTAPVMSVLGDKIGANILAQTADMPSAPWSGSFGGENDGPLQAVLTEEGTIPEETFEKATCRTVEEAMEVGERIGYENGIMIKASEGGGGKGIRLVYNEEELKNAFVQVQNEVIGSPIFLMQLCENNRHIEVQIVGDEHGSAVAINGRDCSTQRRFQKIFEEGPPSCVPEDTFHEMERAAQRLTQSIGYIGAGTVEYLFNAETNQFYFLELNPRLQVEHPVTEGISDVNIPATQLQVAMGIPLSSMPDIRRFYGKKDMYGTSEIDFMTEAYKHIDSHVIAARITAENPDEGFKPTAGKIERIKFQSAGNVWGYFCIGPNGGIHEFADSQFGHVFAKGPTREHARKSLVLALKEMEVRGEIRTTVEYLVQLLETEDFKNNKVTTSWLDGILKEKKVQVERPPHLVVTSAAVFRAFQHIKGELENVVESFNKGQVSVGGLASMNSFDIEIAYKDIKYGFHVELVGPDVYRLTLGGRSMEIQVTETAEGGLLATIGGEMHRIVGMEEPLGLRLVLDGATILMPNIIDPSELRTDVTGKVVRYLQDNGGNVEAGEPYIEVEAMKMIMTMKAEESGKIAHALSPGSVIAAGDLLASLELKDPSKVKKIAVFDGELDIADTPLDVEANEAVANILSGYKNDPEAAAQAAFAASDDEATFDLITKTLEEFHRVESIFDGKVLDDVVRDLTKTNSDDLSVAIKEIQAHQKLDMRTKLVSAMLRQIATLRDRFAIDALPESLLGALEKLTTFKGKEYGDLKNEADIIIRLSKVPPFDVRVEGLRSQLLDKDADLGKVAKSMRVSAGVDLLTYLFGDDDKQVRAAALEVYVRRIYRAHRMIDLYVEEKDGRMTVSWEYQYMDSPTATSTVRHGMMTVVSSLDKLSDDVPTILNDFGSKLENTKSPGIPVHELYIAGPTSESDLGDIAKLEKTIASQEREMKMLGISRATILHPIAKKDPSYFTFPHYKSYNEDPLRRNMRPTFHHLLEINRLTENFDLERLHAVGKEVQVYLGKEKGGKPVRGGPPQVVFVRGISSTPGITTMDGAERLLLLGLDEMERAQANSKVNKKASSRIFLHTIPPLDNTTPEEVAEKFYKIMDELKGRHARRLLKLNVDEIEIVVRVSTTDEDGKPMHQSVRLKTSSMEGEWLKTSAYSEMPDPVDGCVREACTIGESSVCMVDPYESSSIVQTKRSIARAVGSTYAYDFLGLLEVGLLGQWDAYIQAIGRDTTIPAGIFQSKELIEDENGDLVAGSRPIGSNKVGMVAWHVTLKTPEYPEGRDVVFIANDVTVKSGSFAVAEDEVYYKASEYARKNGLPRIYIACNAGARIGLYDDLKSKVNVKFIDKENPSKGFEYLYLSDEDYAGLPEGAVNAHKVDEGWAIDDIIGTDDAIGVENLQGSGKIAGETSRAYNDIFTLSYCTGRSVGIGAYLLRLGQRVIQKTEGPIILTGYQALNKLLGREVYTSQDQLGGPQIMIPNGVSHIEVENDQDGVAEILEWLSFVPKNVGSLPAVRESADPVTRDVEFRPSKAPYDPRNMLGGSATQKGFFDDGSFKEYLAGWGKSVVIGRGRLGGIPMGAIAVETRQVEQIIPADPANPESRESVLPQAGQVLYPDSSYKTAQAIRDFEKEGLPVMIFANWRGFSGGSRDMYGEILKFGAMIVDALREYSHPVYIYIPPYGELRGGSWVVFDPTINGEQMEMYADPDSRGGILEPAGITEIKFRERDQVAMMHRDDTVLQILDSELEMIDPTDTDRIDDLNAQIAARENILKPVYLQAATEFADLHDKTGRMKAKNVIRDAVPWENSREYFYNRSKRRMVEDDLAQKLQSATIGALTKTEAKEKMREMFDIEWENDSAVIGFFADNVSKVDDKIKSMKKEAILSKIKALESEIDE